MRILGALLLLTGMGILAFWGAFLADREGQSASDLALAEPCWYPWERSFILADSWAALVCLLGGLGLLRRRSWGVMWGLLAAGALVFLGCMDVLFFLQNGLYALRTVEVTVEIVIHAWVLLLGLGTAFVVWQAWPEVLGATKR